MALKLQLRMVQTLKSEVDGLQEEWTERRKRKKFPLVNGKLQSDHMIKFLDFTAP